MRVPRGLPSVVDEHARVGVEPHVRAVIAAGRVLGPHDDRPDLVAGLDVRVRQRLLDRADDDLSPTPAVRRVILPRAVEPPRTPITWTTLAPLLSATPILRFLLDHSCVMRLPGSWRDCRFSLRLRPVRAFSTDPDEHPALGLGDRTALGDLDAVADDATRSFSSCTCSTVRRRTYLPYLGCFDLVADRPPCGSCRGVGLDDADPLRRARWSFER